MSLLSKLGISLLVAIAAATLTTLMMTGTWFNFRLLIAFFFATTATAILINAGQRTSAEVDTPAKPRQAPDTHTPTAATDGDRVEGEVKWFNAAKGFGFIKQDSGGEVFVHFRSIRGTGRRGLRDGQRVSFILADSDKGPQAEDVEALT